MLRRSALLISVLLAPLACASKPTDKPAAAALDPKDVRARCQTLLSGYERVPTEADFAPLGAAALPALEAIRADPASLPTTRSRAVSAMGLLKDPAAVERLKGLAADAELEESQRSAALLALAHRAGEGALPQLAPLLDDPNPRLRDSAARAVARVGTPDARKSLEGRLEKESDPGVREAIQQNLTKMEP
jgi:HEAT repeat protein